MADRPFGFGLPEQPGDPERKPGDQNPFGPLGDADQLRQVLANLLRNALVHTPAGTPIEVSVRPGVQLEVRDHGPGLPGDDPSALFERFWRAEGGRERGKGGAGLGLARGRFWFPLGPFLRDEPCPVFPRVFMFATFAARQGERTHERPD